MAADTSGPMPLSDEPLSPAELVAVRRMLMSRYRDKWAWRQSRALVPALIAIAVALWQFGSWFGSIFQLRK